MRNFLAFGLCIIIQMSFSQTFTKRDSLQGGLPFERTCFDVQEYGIAIYDINMQEKSISGLSMISFNVIENTKRIQLDLFENMKVDSIKIVNKKNLSPEKLSYKREYDAVFIDFEEELQKGKQELIFFYYSGKPKEAKNAPWDGGFVWKKDSNGKPFVGVAVQGTGSSLWYPCKDSQSDEPDNGITFTIVAPDDLVAVSNGRLQDKYDLKNGKIFWAWEVKNPINNYNITLNIGDYVHFSDTLNSLDLDYYVLRENEQKAKKHFEDDVKPMLQCFQEKFGAYPFPEDGYKLVETPYLRSEERRVGKECR